MRTGDSEASDGVKDDDERGNTSGEVDSDTLDALPAPGVEEEEDMGIQENVAQEKGIQVRERGCERSWKGETKHHKD